MFVAELFLGKKRNLPEPKIPDLILPVMDEDSAFSVPTPAGTEVP